MAGDRVIYKGFKQGVTLEDLREEMRTFAEERDWNKFHIPRNLLLALVGEVGELSEIFQWRGEVSPGLPDFEEKDRVHLGEELSDVLLYLIRLSDRCHIDLPTAALRKMEKNRRKYPKDKVKGKSDKYTAYQNGGAKNDISAKTEQETKTVTPKAASCSTSNVSGYKTYLGQIFVVSIAVVLFGILKLAVGS
ncbi:hypothetical protein AAMO2058_000024900 [Amorphochlora amoebiformis]